MKKFLWTLIPTFLTIVSIYYAWIFVEKNLSVFIKNQTHFFAKEKLNWNVEIENLKIQLLPPSVLISQVKVAPEDHIILPFTVDMIEVRLDFLSLLGGRIELSRLRTQGLDLDIDLEQMPENKDSIKNEIPTELIFNFLQQLPVRNIIIDESSFGLKSKTKFYHVTHLNSVFQYDGKTISSFINSDFQYLDKEQYSSLVKIKWRSQLSKRDFHIDELSLRSDKSELNFTGKTSQLKTFLTKPEGEFFYSLKTDFEEWNTILKTFIKDAPLLKGQLQISGNGKWNHTATENNKPAKKDTFQFLIPSLNADVQLHQFVFATYAIGDLNFKADWDHKKMRSEKMTLNHPAGIVHLNSFQLETENDFSISALVHLDSLDLQKLFLNLDLTEIPVDLGVKSQLDCKGTLNSFLLKCTGKVQGHDLRVASEKGSKGSTIVQLDDFSGEGWLTVDSQKVTYDSSIQLHESTGASQGEISFEKGFNINYQTENLQLEHIKNLVQLDFKGKVKLKGKTEGNSHFGTIEMLAETQDFWFEKFGLGHIVAPIEYKAGTLSIKTEQASFLDTQYMGFIDVNLINNTLKGEFESPVLFAENIAMSLAKKVEIPVGISGKGNARVQFSGPFSLGKMSYKLESQLKKGSIAEELYDEINVDINAKDGNVTVSNNTLRKNKSLIEVNGTANPNGIIHLDFIGKNFHLEESSWVSKVFPSLTGQMQFDMSLSNHILQPDVIFKSHVTRSILGDIELPDSKLFFKIDKEGFSGSTDLIGHQIVSEINIPFNKNQNARFYLDVYKLDFTEILGLSSDNPIRSEYKSTLTMKLDLKSETSSFLDASGSLKVEELQIARNNDYFSPKKPLVMIFEKGQAQLNDYMLTGPETSITIKGKNFSLRDLNILISGNLNLKVIQLFLPFFEDFGGIAKGELQVSGSILAPEMYGDVNIHDAFLRFKGFPHPLEKLTAHLDFNNNKINLNSIRGSLANGSVLGDGSIEWHGAKDLPINIRAQIRDVSLNIPEKIHTQGSGEIVFSGHTLPYSITGIYRVKQGLIEKDFASSNGANSNSVKQSIYLPKNIQVNQIDPIRLDLQIIMDQNIEIKNPQMAGFIVGQFQVKGDPANPILKGLIKMQHGTQLLFRDKKFDVLSGLIKFNDPNELNPELFISARSRIDPYDVNLMIQGTSSKPQILLSSQPPLEDQDLISLLALGVTTHKLDKDIQSSQQAAQTGYQLGTAIISANPLNKEIKDSLGVDVKFSSSFDDTKNVAVPKVTVAKELIPKKLNVSASSSMSDIQLYDVRLQYLLNDNLSAVGTYQDTNSVTNTTTTNTGNTAKISIFGLDLEYKVEFK